MGPWGAGLPVAGSAGCSGQNLNELLRRSFVVRRWLLVLLRVASKCKIIMTVSEKAE